MGRIEPATSYAAEVARGLVGAPVDAIEPVGRGRNSRVFRVHSGGETYALKQYPSRTDDARDRLGAEADALTLMERQGLEGVPRLRGTDRERGFALLSWLEGGPVGEISDADIDAATAFLTAVHGLRSAGMIPAERLASEACLSGAEIVRQIEARRTRLDELDEPELRAFLSRDFAPRLDQTRAAAQDQLTAAGLSFAALLPQERRSLVPSDFGFHNSLRRSDGSLAFFDFEYFGWDDPVKLTADCLLHPGTPVGAAQRNRLRRSAITIYGNDPGFEHRLRAFTPLFGLRWVLILLNEFLPDRWRRRVAAGAASDWNEAKRRQLAAARGLLERVTGDAGGGDVMTGALAVNRAAPAVLDDRSRYLRRLIVRALDKGQRGHIGSSMSLVEILRVLYDEVLRYQPQDPKWPSRDRMILSKGHGCLALYVMLADKGFIPIEALDTFCHRDSILGGHPEAAKIPGVEASTGALGHGLSIGLGMALAARMQGRDSRVFVVMGDGEINEGSVWEAAMCAGKHKLANLTAMIDYNKIQSAGPTREIQDLEPLVDKWRAFGFAVAEVDGHDVEALREVFARLPLAGDRPSAIICHTVKGKGIPFAEHDPNWHHKAKLAADVVNQMYAALE